MKIAISINTSWNIYNFRINLLKALQDEGHEIITIAPRDEYSTKLEELGFKYIPIAIHNKGANPIQDFKLMKQYKKIYALEKPDVILHYTIKPNIYGTLAAKKLGIPAINNVSGLGTVFLHRNIVSALAKKLYKKSFKSPYKVFFQNDDDRNLFIKNKLIKKSITDLLPGSGIDLNRFQFSPKKRKHEFIFLVPARLLYDKGIVEFVEAVQILKNENMQARFCLIGFMDKSKLGIPSNQLNYWVENNIIEYWGVSDKVETEMQKADAIVLPSYREGTPKALLEALALGKPIITTDVPGCKETVINDVNGYLCSAKSGQSLAEKMLKIYHLSENELSSMSKKSRELAEGKFDEKIVIKKYINTINSLNNNES